MQGTEGGSLDRQGYLYHEAESTGTTLCIVKLASATCIRQRPTVPNIYPSWSRLSLVTVSKIRDTSPVKSKNSEDFLLPHGATADSRHATPNQPWCKRRAAYRYGHLGCMNTSSQAPQILDKILLTSVYVGLSCCHVRGQNS